MKNVRKLGKSHLQNLLKRLFLACSINFILVALEFKESRAYVLNYTRKKGCKRKRWIWTRYNGATAETTTMTKLGRTAVEVLKGQKITPGMFPLVSCFDEEKV